jgi:hypothetical protein
MDYPNSTTNPPSRKATADRRMPNVETREGPRITRHGGQAANKREKFRQEKSLALIGVIRGQIFL